MTESMRLAGHGGVLPCEEQVFLDELHAHALTGESLDLFTQVIEVALELAFLVLVHRADMNVGCARPSARRPRAMLSCTVQASISCWILRANPRSFRWSWVLKSRGFWSITSRAPMFQPRRPCKGNPA